MMSYQSPFLDTLFLLRKEECITLFAGIGEISSKEIQEASGYFEAEFGKEKLEFLSDTMPFDAAAAVWAGKVLYHSAQLYLIRKDTFKDLEKLIPEWDGKKDIPAKLSADLSLRFLPQVFSALKEADPEDPLVFLLEGILKQFHYSAIGLDLDLKNVNWEEELEDTTYRKLYLERIVEKKAFSLAEVPFLNRLLMAEFGMYRDVFWKELM
ncbi:hypothetical protein [uncultured Chryseobacterium sp.]|uniref:hypothetical protein n=1 Tax=uncultured Chryseobacterium sp. TaxID=259322 RepID=UPI0025ED8F1D|nr:hypothetical protein [uncultured Chryseobacterium sp.]